MALIVEDGTGMDLAESYASVEEMDAYDVARNAPAEAVDLAAQERALRRATAWIEATYHGRWKGRRATALQGLAWPRVGAVDPEGFSIASTSVPRAVKHATIEVAIAILEGASLDTRPDQTAAVSRKRVKAGPVETETEYALPARSPRFSRVDGLLVGLIDATSNFVGTAVRV
ncbi:MAG TPA: DnaT-like ssDNA-binding protein [Microvirga sp.]|jgi:hypothetical protein|nr:DnaT-like ssDNA-binding protein [Microvirga sp.]